MTKAESTDEETRFRPLIERYLEWLVVNNYSPSTGHIRRWHLRHFQAWCEERDLFRPVDVTLPAVERYQKWIYYYRQANGQPLGRSTQNGYLGSVLSFFRWLKKHGHLLSNPAAEIERPRVERTLPRRILSAKDVERVLHEIDVEDPLGLRDRAILETFYSTGIRRAELLKLRLYDLDAERGTLMIRLGKGKKDRVVPIGKRAVAWVTKYIEESRPLFVAGVDDDAIFIGNRGKPLSEITMLRIARKWLTAAGVYKPGSGCHIFRHTAATLMLEGGADIRFIQAMLGHEQLTTTQIYTRVSIEKLKEVHAKTHPARLYRERTEQPADSDTEGADPKPE